MARDIKLMLGLKGAGKFGNPGPKRMPTLKKIDFYGCIILVLSVYFVQLLLAEANPATTIMRLTIPNDMMLEGPVIVNLTNPDLHAKPLQCNPHYAKFRRDYITDDLKNLVKVKSEEYLALDEVSTIVNETTRIQRHSTTTFAMSPVGLCEMIPPSHYYGQCMTFYEIESDCLGGDCGTDPNVCFWKQRIAVECAAIGQLIVYLAALLQTFGLVFDPPPARLDKFLNPLFCAVLFLLSGILSMTGLLICITSVKKYAPQIMVETFPEFKITNDLGYTCFMYSGVASVIFSACYFYLGIFTPKYPRQKNRWEVRRQKFEKKLAEIADLNMSEV